MSLSMGRAAETLRQRRSHDYEGGFELCTHCLLL